MSYCWDTLLSVFLEKLYIWIPCLKKKKKKKTNNYSSSPHIRSVSVGFHKPVLRRLSCVRNHANKFYSHETNFIFQNFYHLSLFTLYYKFNVHKTTVKLLLRLTFSIQDRRIHMLEQLNCRATCTSSQEVHMRHAWMETSLREKRFVATGQNFFRGGWW